MAVTIKRQIPEFSNTRNNSQHLNQMTFKGIVENNNIFEVDQQSFKQANNVYVDDNMALISRPPIIVENLPRGYVEIDGATVETPIVPTGYNLVDLFETGAITIYVSLTPANEYHIVAYNKNSAIIKIITAIITKYHITAIENYAIVFNDTDAQVIDINQFNDGWKLLRDMADIPVTKRVVGQETFTYPKNQFTDSYKEDYVWSDGVQQVLPAGDAEVTINQMPESLVWTLPDAQLNTEFRLLRTLNIQLGAEDFVTAAVNNNTGITVMCIGRADNVMISVDGGQSFKRVLYPIGGTFLNIASVSKDALYYYFVASDGVYRYSLDTEEWVVIRLLGLGDTQHPLVGVGSNNTCCFNNDEVFSFVLYYDDSGPVADLYWKGPGLTSATYANNTLGKTKLTNIDPESQLNMTRTDNAYHSIVVKVRTESAAQITDIVAWLPQMSGGTTSFVMILGQGDTDPIIANQQTLGKSYGMVIDFNILDEHPDPAFLQDFRGLEVEAITTEANRWYRTKLSIGQEDVSDYTDGPPSTITWGDYYTFEYIQDLGASVNANGAPIDLDTAHIVNYQIYSVDGASGLPTALNGEPWPNGQIRRFTISVGSIFYMGINDTIYTNQILSSSNVVISYTRNLTTPYTEIPDVTHVNNELYMSFDNRLKITANSRDGSDFKFSLPEINNHSFTSKVNAMINISTTQVAIFLINQVFLVVQVADELLGYRYDYYNTRLSIGVRHGDTVINTRDGMLTLYPTSQGLAVMNYQQDVANLDQVVDYVSKNIFRLWRAFYSAGGPVEIVQMKDYLYISNNTNQYLMLDLRTMSWWEMSSPVPIMKFVTDQFEMSIISNGLYQFDLTHTVYKDLYTNFINWRFESQPLHFGLPNHYKNVRQLIFQLEETTDLLQTIASQIKLYRKSLTIREPEIIGFKVSSYRTFIKRFNYWKINELQWALGADEETVTPAQLKLNGISIKYEISEEVRS